MLGQLRGWEWLIIVALILLLFGAKRLPDAARGLGRSLRIFKAETKGLTGDDSATSEDATPVTPATPAVAPPVAAPPAALPPTTEAPQAAVAEPRPVEQPERSEG